MCLRSSYLRRSPGTLRLAQFAFAEPQSEPQPNASPVCEQLWMIIWMAMVSSRDRPREGARGAQRTYRGGAEGDYRRDPAKWGCWVLIGHSQLL